MDPNRSTARHGVVLAFAIAALVLLADLHAEVWRVDPSHSATNTFATLVEAIAAARDGDTIVVAAGVHAMPGLVSKGVRIVGEPGATLDPTRSPLRVSGLAANARFVLAHVAIQEPFEPRIQLDGNRGAVHLFDVHGNDRAGLSTRSPGVWIADSDLVTIDACAFGGAPAIDVRRSRVRISGGAFRGASAAHGTVGGAAVHGAEATLEIADARLRGSDRFLVVAPTPAIDVQSCSVQILGGDSVVFGGSDPTGPGAPPVAADVRCRIELGGNVVLAAGTAWQDRVVGAPVERLGTRGVLRVIPDGTGFVLRLTGTPWAGALIVAGRLAIPQPIALGTCWLDPASAVVVTTAVLDGDGRGAVPLELPTGFGVVACLQAALIVQAGMEPSSATLVVGGA